MSPNVPALPTHSTSMRDAPSDGEQQHHGRDQHLAGDGGEAEPQRHRPVDHDGDHRGADQHAVGQSGRAPCPASTPGGSAGPRSRRPSRWRRARPAGSRPPSAGAPKSSHRKSGMHRAAPGDDVGCGEDPVQPFVAPRHESTGAAPGDLAAVPAVCAEWRSASIRTVPGLRYQPAPAHPSPRSSPRPTTSSRSTERVAPGLAEPGQRRAGRAARGRPPRRARPLRRGQPTSSPAGRPTGILPPTPSPSLYPYRMTDTAGRATTGVIGALGLAEPGAESDILPHEQTLPKPKSDRLDLLRATRANLSPIWGLSMAAGRHRDLRPDRRRAGGRRLRRRRRAPPALGAAATPTRWRPSATPWPRRPSCWPTATTATRRPGRTRPSAGRPTAASPAPTTW